jgi:hypothetical protein
MLQNQMRDISSLSHLRAVGQSAGARKKAERSIFAKTLPLFHEALPSDTRHKIEIMSREQRFKKKIGCTVSQRANLDLTRQDRFRHPSAVGGGGSACDSGNSDCDRLMCR